MMFVEDLSCHMVTGMFKVTSRYDMVNEYTGKTEFTEDAGMPVEMFRNDYSGWMVTYMTIENGDLVVGLIPPDEGCKPAGACNPGLTLSA